MVQVQCSNDTSTHPTTHTPPSHSHHRYYRLRNWCIKVWFVVNDVTPGSLVKAQIYYSEGCSEKAVVDRLVRPLLNRF